MKENRIIEVHKVSKKYWIRGGDQNPHRSLKGSLYQFLTGKSKHLSQKPFWAIEDISFTLHRGGIVAILGNNGSGKSTLLRIIAQVTEPTYRKVTVYGRLGALLEVGTGMHPGLTGIDNIYFCGAVLGMKRADIRRQLEAIVEFAGIEAFLYTPLKRHSSGMVMRLANSVLLHLRTDLLILDEGFSVGDVEFQTRCFEKVKAISQEGRTILCVTHHEGWISSYCERAILLHQGKLIEDGHPVSVLENYHALLKKETDHSLHLEDRLHEAIHSEVEPHSVCAK